MKCAAGVNEPRAAQNRSRTVEVLPWRSGPRAAPEIQTCSSTPRSWWSPASCASSLQDRKTQQVHKQEVRTFLRLQLTNESVNI